MPSLGELLRCVEKAGGRAYSPEAYALLEKLVSTVLALVEAVEPEGIPTGEYERAEARATIRQLRKDYDRAKDEHEEYKAMARGAKAEIERLRKNAASEWHAQARQAYEAKCTELAEAKAEIERLRKRKEWWEHSIESWKAEEQSWHEETNGLRAEIERLQKNCDYLRRRKGDALDRLVDAKRQLAETRKELESYTASVNADAVLAALVRGMPDSTALQHTGAQYYAMRSCLGGGWRPIMTSCATDPTQALRSIQGDDNG